MVTRSITFAPGEFYHIYNRGTEKRIIFQDIADYQRFTELLFLSNSSGPINVRNIRNRENSIFDFDRGQTLVNIGAYCLMPNHFHVLATPIVENGLSIFMNKLGTSYSMYFNKRYDRTGSLFQGTYKAEFADSDEYLKYLFSYIHLNPVKLIAPHWRESGGNEAGKLYDFARLYEHSSLIDHLGIERPQKAILNIATFPQYFSTPAKTEGELFEWLTYNQ